jgi:hypothetical protein
MRFSTLATSSCDMPMLVGVGRNMMTLLDNLLTIRSAEVMKSGHAVELHCDNNDLPAQAAAIHAEGATVVLTEAVGVKTFQAGFTLSQKCGKCGG